MITMNMMIAIIAIMTGDLYDGVCACVRVCVKIKKTKFVLCVLCFLFLLYWVILIVSG